MVTKFLARNITAVFFGAFTLIPTLVLFVGHQ